MASKIGKGEWFAVYAVAGAIDVAQWGADLTGIGAGINEVIDPFIGLAIAGYFQIRGVSMLRDLKRLGSLIGATGLEEISVSVAPAWIADVWYIHRTVKQEEAMTQAAQAAQADADAGVQGPRRTVYTNGRREPPAETAANPTRSLNYRPAITDGVRAPQKRPS